MKRREFIGTAAAASSLALIGNYSWAKPVQPIGVQLYTVRDAISKDLEGTLKRVAEIGYTHVEAAGYGGGKFYGKTPAEFKSLLASVGLRMPSSHTGYNFFTNDPQKTIDDAAEVGLEFVIMPWLAPDQRKTLDDYRKICEVLNKAGELAKKHNITIGYHNHDFEFTPLENQLPFDVMMGELDPAITMELDLYWITRAGYNPLDYFKKYSGRIQLWHVKDMADTAEKEFAPVGTGTIDFKSIFTKAKLSGLKYFFVEQDRTNGSSFDSIKTSYDNVVKI